MVAQQKPRVRVNKYGIIRDGLANVVSGLGASNPRVAANFYEASSVVGMADAAFRTSTWYGKILTIPVDDAVRKWRKWIAEKSQSDMLYKEERRLDYRMMARKALLMARHEGGAVLVPGGLPGSVTSQLDLERVTKESVQYIHVLSRNDVSFTELERDPTSPNYGNPKMWRINTGARNLEIHGSRVFPINGRTVPGTLDRRGQYWGDSIWLHLADAVIAADSGASIVSALMHEAKLDVVSIPDLATLLSAPEGEQTITDRWTLASRLKSIANILLIDGGPQTENAKEEKWNQKQIRWDGLPDVLRILLTVLSGAADIPYTRLTGDQQKGLSNNDDGSLRNYYSSVNTRQVLEIEPMLRPLDEILIRSAIGSRPDGLWYEWESLYEMSDQDRAEIDKKDAETAQIYAGSALVDVKALEKAVVTRMMESGRWPGIGPEDVAGGTGPLQDPGVPGDPSDPALPGDPADPVQRPSSARGAATDAAPRPLYVSRRVLNASAILKWAKEQGLENLEKAEDLHVTITYSRKPVDWMRVPAPWDGKLEVPAGGPRIMDMFGPEDNKVVLLFKSNELEWRHESIKAAGASHDWGDYQPHITIATMETMPADIVAYQGVIMLGPEIFEDLKED